jgi:hypothetical protein
VNGAFALAAWEGDQFEQAADGQVSLCGMAQRAARGIRGVVAHSDPEPRTRLTTHGPELIFPGHYGTIYQAKGMDYLGKTRPRRLTMLPDGSVLHSGVRAGSPRLLGGREPAFQQVDRTVLACHSMV